MMMMDGAKDSNNYLDVRNETHFQNQGTVRVDHIFSNNDTLFAPLLARLGERLLSQQRSDGDHGKSARLWRELRQPVAAGRHFVESRFLEQQAQHGFGRGFAAVDGPHVAEQRCQRHRRSTGHSRNRIRRPGSLGRPMVRRAGLHRHRRHVCRDPHACLGHDDRVPRHVCLAARPSCHEASAATSVATSGRCGASSRIAASTNTPTATPRSSVSTMAAARDLPACC